MKRGKYSTKKTLTVIAVAICLVAVFVQLRRLRNEAEQQDLCVLREACENLQEGSDHLTEHVRRFVESDGSEAERDAYFKEAKKDRNREQAIRHLAAARQRDVAVRFLYEAMEMSLSLMLKEYHAMRLMTREERLPFAPSELRGFRLTDEERVLTWEERCSRAREEVFGKGYDDYKVGISRRITFALARAGWEEIR